MDFIRWWVLSNERMLSEMFPVFCFMAFFPIAVGFMMHLAIGLVILIVSTLVLGTIAYVFIERWWKQKHAEFEKHTKKSDTQKPL